MGIKKKKNVIVIAVCVFVSFILYQLYFFLTITSETAAGFKLVTVIDHSKLIYPKDHVRSEADKYINENGIIRGVHYALMPRYRPDSNREFKCLNSDQRIPFDQVNDDYCDCDDSSDEPSTTACVNGTFFCDTQYPNKQVAYNKVLSNKVNDGICDCCDGSDEWLQGPHQKLLSQSSSKHYRHYVVKCPSNCFK
ncbi:hypothetical protein ABMA27_001226 [Loxostege sticticalis]|uniref:Glucosidase II beta subunit N-terminal domain-containing protein n=1 Tax=Loxostege sticticalis TaxID=481309 RepID=A0ABR3HXS2_LOXSC